MKIQNKLIVCLGIAMIFVSSISLFGMKRPRTGTSPEESPDITQHQDIQYEISRKFQQFPMILNAIQFLVWQPMILESTSRIRSIATNGDLVVLGSQDGTAKIWHMATGQQLMPYADHNSPVSMIAISSDIIVSGSDDGTVKIWKTNGETLHTFKETSEILSVAITHDKVVIGTNDRIIKVRSLTTGEVLLALKPFRHEIKISDDKMIGISDRGIAGIWDINTGELIHTLESGLQPRFQVAINNEKAITTTKDTLKIWSVNTGKLLHTIKDKNTDTISSIAINGDTMVTALWNRSAAIWNINTGQLLRPLILSEIQPLKVAISKNKIVTTPGNTLAKIWIIDPLKGTQDTNPLLWIINYATVPQLDFIKRVYEATVIFEELVIAFPSEDAKVFLSFPTHVKQYLLARLKIRR